MSIKLIAEADATINELKKENPFDLPTLIGNIDFENVDIPTFKGQKLDELEEYLKKVEAFLYTCPIERKAKSFIKQLLGDLKDYQPRICYMIWGNCRDFINTEDLPEGYYIDDSGGIRDNSHNYVYNQSVFIALYYDKRYEPLVNALNYLSEILIEALQDISNRFDENTKLNRLSMSARFNRMQTAQANDYGFDQVAEYLKPAQVDSPEARADSGDEARSLPPIDDKYTLAVLFEDPLKYEAVITRLVESGRIFREDGKLIFNPMRSKAKYELIALFKALGFKPWLKKRDLKNKEILTVLKNTFFEYDTVDRSFSAPNMPNAIAEYLKLLSGI